MHITQLPIRWARFILAKHHLNPNPGILAGKKAILHTAFSKYESLIFFIPEILIARSRFSQTIGLTHLCPTCP
jgi:hypothetical protein